MTTCTTASSWRGKRCWLRQVLHSQSLRGYFAKSIRFWPNHFTAIESRMYHGDCEHVWRKPDSELQSGSREGGRWPIPQGPRLWPGGSLSCCPCFPAVTSVPNSSPPSLLLSSTENTLLLCPLHLSQGQQGACNEKWFHCVSNKLISAEIK